MEYYNAAVSFLSTHPIAYTVVVAGFSAVGGHKAIEAGIDKIVKGAATYQDGKLKAAGLPPARRKQVLLEEALAADRAAADLRAVAAGIVLESIPAPTVPTAPPAAP